MLFWEIKMIVCGQFREFSHLFLFSQLFLFSHLFPKYFQFLTCFLDYFLIISWLFLTPQLPSQLILTS